MRKILVVEDDTPLREAYSIILSTQAYDIHLAVNGSQALTICLENEFDLILLDLMMPEMNGLEFLEQFSDRKPDKTKIIMLSNVTTNKDLTRCLSLGAHKTVVKSSIGPKQLLSLVRYELEG